MPLLLLLLLLPAHHFPKGQHAPARAGITWCGVVHPAPCLSLAPACLQTAEQSLEVAQEACNDLDMRATQADAARAAVESELAAERERLEGAVAALQAQVAEAQQASEALQVELAAATEAAAQAEEGRAAAAAEVEAVRAQLAGEAEEVQAALAAELAAAQAELAAEGERLQGELDQAQSVALQLVAEKEQLEVGGARVGGWASVREQLCCSVVQLLAAPAPCLTAGW